MKVIAARNVQRVAAVPCKRHEQLQHVVPSRQLSTLLMAAKEPLQAPVRASVADGERCAAWHITQQGDMGSLKLVEQPWPVVQPGHVLVRVQAWGLNFADVFCALGLYKAAPKGDFVPGLEFAGTVLQVSAEPMTQAISGTGSQEQQQQQQCSYKPGDRVLGVLRFGAFASHVALPAAYLRPVPPHWSLEEAASYPVQTLTAAYGLFEAGAFRAGQAVLVQSAAGGVGLQALQILSKSNAAVLGLVGSASKLELLQGKFGSPADLAVEGRRGLAHKQQQEQGQNQCLQQQQDTLHRPGPYMEFAVRESDTAAVQGQLQGFLERSGCSGFDVILDSLGPGPYFQPCYDALNPCGRHVIFGAGSLTPRPGLKISLNLLSLLTAPRSLLGMLKLGWAWLWRPRLDVINMPGDNKGVLGFNLIWLYNRLDVLAGLYDKVDNLELDPPVVGRVFSFQQLPDALAYLQSGQSVGKVVLSINAACDPAADAEKESE